MADRSDALARFATVVKQATASGAVCSITVTGVAGQRFAADVNAFNPVFDVTPADLIDVIVTEKGVVERPDTAKLAKLMCRKRLH